MVPKWFENLLLILVFGLLGGFMGLAGPGFAWGAIIGLVIDEVPMWLGISLIVVGAVGSAALRKFAPATNRKQSG